jgi:hypothetical protein
MDQNAKTTLPIEGKRYFLRYKNEYDQVAVLEGDLVHLELNGFVVMNVESTTTLIPKDRIYSLREADNG